MSLMSQALRGRFLTTSAIWEVPVYIIQHINTQALTLVTVSPLLPMSDAKLSWTPGLWQSSHRFPPWLRPHLPLFVHPLSGPLTAAKSAKGCLLCLSPCGLCCTSLDSQGSESSSDPVSPLE